jgi:hypothetical protein
MADPYSGAAGSTKQEINVLNEAKQRRPKGQVITKVEEDGDKKKGKKKDKDPINPATLYTTGVKLLEKAGYQIEANECGPHVKHIIRRPALAPEVKGIQYPDSFRPFQEIHQVSDLEALDSIFNEVICGADVREFWQPIFKPQPGESALHLFIERYLKMKQISEQMAIHEPMNLQHSFDPAGRLGRKPAHNPLVWVPDRAWFDPVLHNLKFSDVFTIFPHAEQELLKLILGRVGVGRTNHIPPGWGEPIKHTARMAAVIVGKDPGLGKSTIFNGMTAAFSKCGFSTHTFKDVENRFGLKGAALSNIAYKDDTSLISLKKFLASESTKILVTNGIFETEEKYMNPEQVQPRTVIIVNSNDWNNKFAYDLDPGIIDRIKVISTLRELEVKNMLKNNTLAGTLSEGSPDLRPYSHIPFLAEKLGVSQEAIYLWCLRLATDRFWEIISDNSDPMVNRLQMEVRYWTSRQKIRFKADVIQSVVNAMAFAHALRTNPSSPKFMPEFNLSFLYEYLRSLYFVAVDPSCQPVTKLMKESWKKTGGSSSHYFEGFRELRWNSVKTATMAAREILFDENNQRKPSSKEAVSMKTVKDIFEILALRDGFKMGGEASYVIETWENCRANEEELFEEARHLASLMDEEDLKRLRTVNPDRCIDTWLMHPSYSPDSAEEIRTMAWEKLHNIERPSLTEGVKEPTNRNQVSINKG